MDWSDGFGLFFEGVDDLKFSFYDLSVLHIYREEYVAVIFEGCSHYESVVILKTVAFFQVQRFDLRHECKRLDCQDGVEFQNSFFDECGIDMKFFQEYV